MTFALVFPGQGSQKTGMLAELAADHTAVSEVFSEAHEHFGKDLWSLAQTGPDAKLADTRITQSLMFTSGVAVWRALVAAGLPQPNVVAGHSLGEFAALVAAGVLSFSDGCKLQRWLQTGRSKSRINGRSRAGRRRWHGSFTRTRRCRR